MTYYPQRFVPPKNLWRLWDVLGRVVPLPPRPGSDVLHRLRASGHPAAARVVHEMCKVHGSWEMVGLTGSEFILGGWKQLENTVNQSNYDVVCMPLFWKIVHRPGGSWSLFERFLRFVRNWSNSCTVPFYGNTLSRKKGHEKESCQEERSWKVLGEGMGSLVGNAMRIVELKSGYQTSCWTKSESLQRFYLINLAPKAWLILECTTYFLG